MENVLTALQLCFIAQRNFVWLTNKPQTCIDYLRRISTETFSIHDIVEIDLLQCQNSIYQDITDQMVIREEGCQPRLHEIIIWKNLERMDLAFEGKNALVRIFNELEQYNTLRSRGRDGAEPFQFGNYTVVKPELCCVVPIMELGDCPPKIHHHIKDRFWFAQYCYLTDKTPTLPSIESGRLKVLEARHELGQVYANPQIQEYICSLLVFTRSHRLCSLAPLTTRPTFKALEGIMLLSQALVVLKSKDESQLYVTPEYVKVAYRKIGYWLVDWETNCLFNNDSPDSMYQKKMELTILTGDWYGSEWSSAEQYMFDFATTKDKNSTTGFTNKIIEDVLLSVRPPL